MVRPASSTPTMSSASPVMRSSVASPSPASQRDKASIAGGPSSMRAIMPRSWTGPKRDRNRGVYSAPGLTSARASRYQNGLRHLPTPASAAPVTTREELRTLERLWLFAGERDVRIEDQLLGIDRVVHAERGAARDDEV